MHIDLGSANFPDYLLLCATRYHKLSDAAQEWPANQIHPVLVHILLPSPSIFTVYMKLSLGAPSTTTLQGRIITAKVTCFYPITPHLSSLYVGHLAQSGLGTPSGAVQQGFAEPYRAYPLLN